MSKQYFDVEFNGKTFKFWLDEKGEVWYFDDEGHPTSMVHQRSIVSMEEARQVALEMLDGHGR